MEPTKTLEDLEKELIENDPTYDPLEGINWRPIRTKLEYPELEEIWYGNKPSHKVLETHLNLMFLLDKFNITLRYNLMTRRREITIPGLHIFQDDIDNDTLARIEHLATINFLSHRQIDKFLDMLCAAKPYHPIVECIKDNPWDGTPRLDDFIKTVHATNPVLAKEIITTWMIAGVAAAHSATGFTNQGVLVLQGNQGVGKTEWLKSLDPISCGAVKEGALLDPRAKDSVITLAAFWIIELGELDATFNKADIALLKSFITNHVDEVRLPYARRNTRMIRRSVYAATVNSDQFLVDSTGNRRWWTLSVTHCDWNHGFDMKQVWAEVYHLWKGGKQPYLNREAQEAVNHSNVSHEQIDPMHEQLLAKFDWSHSVFQWMTATHVLEALGYQKPTVGEVRRMSRILVQINKQQPKRSNGKTEHKVPNRFNINQSNIC